MASGHHLHLFSEDLGNAVVLGPGEALRPESPGLIYVAEPGPIVPPDGKERQITAAMLDEMVANCDTEIERGKADPFAIDIDHATIRKSGKDSGAIGWGSKLVVKDGKLWATPRWNDGSEELITSKAFRFTSPVIQFDHRDYKTGKNVGARLHSLAITNQPISPGARPMMAASEFLHKESPMKTVKITIDATEYEVPEAVAAAITEKADDTETAEIAEKLTASEATIKELTGKLALSEAKEPDADAVILSAQEWSETKAKAERGESAAVALEAMKVETRLKDLVASGRMTAAEAKTDEIVKAVSDDASFALILSMRAADSAWPASGTKGGVSSVEEGNEDPRERLNKAVTDLIASEAKAGTVVSYADALTRVRRDPAQKATIEAAV